MHTTQGRLMRRQPRHLDTQASAPTRLTRRQYSVVLPALASWQLECKHRLTIYGDAARLRDYILELADLLALASSLPRHVPYDVSVTPTQWDLVSRALRFYAQTVPYALSVRNTWHKHLRWTQIPRDHRYR